MLSVCVDESARNEEFYFLGALLLTREQEAYLTNQLDLVVAKHAEAFPELAGVELHGSTMMNGKDGWDDIPMRVRFKIFTDVLHAVGQSGCIIHVEGIDIVGCNRRLYGVTMEPRERAFSHLFERIDTRGRNAQQKVKVFADEHHTAEVSRAYNSLGREWRSANGPPS